MLSWRKVLPLIVFFVFHFLRPGVFLSLQQFSRPHPPLHLLPARRPAHRLNTGQASTFTASSYNATQLGDTWPGMSRIFALKVLTWPRWEQPIVLQVQAATHSPHLVLPTTTCSSLIGVERAASIFSATAVGLWVDCGRESQAWQGGEDIPAAWGQVGFMRFGFDIVRFGFTIRLTMA